MMVKRILHPSLLRDLDEKIVLLSGPRQCGKTTLSKSLFKKFDYINYDSSQDREILDSETWDRQSDLLILDEIHKMKNWKSRVKGIYDSEGVRPRILVTGSARLNQLKRAGDSLAGRHFHYHLHPFDLKELNLKTVGQREEALDTMLNVGGFPEPFLKGTRRFYNRWSAAHLDVILRQDLIDLESSRDIKSIEVLISLLARKVGSKVSYASLARSLQRDPKTVASWILLLENLYVIFKVSPYHRNIAQSILKESKYYFYDTGRVQGEAFTRFENFVACCLLKEIQRVFDTRGVKGNVYFIQTRKGREIDFLIKMEEGKSWLIEAKWKDTTFSPNFKHFASHFKKVECIQLVKQFQRTKTTAGGLKLVRASDWLADFDFS